MILEDLILKALDKCLETATGEQRRIFLWMKAALLYPGLEQFAQEVKRAGECKGKVSQETLHKAVEFAMSFNECQIQDLSLTYTEKSELTRLERIRLKEVEVRILGILGYLGWIES